MRAVSPLPNVFQHPVSGLFRSVLSASERRCRRTPICCGHQKIGCLNLCRGRGCLCSSYAVSAGNRSHFCRLGGVDAKADNKVCTGYELFCRHSGPSAQVDARSAEVEDVCAEVNAKISNSLMSAMKRITSDVWTNHKSSRSQIVSK